MKRSKGKPVPPKPADLDIQIAIRFSREQIEDLHGALAIHNDVTGRGIDRSQFVREVIMAALHGTVPPQGLPRLRKAG